MDIKTFNFPSFEEWLKDQNWDQDIGAYKCFFKTTHYSYTTEVLYEAYIIEYYWSENIVVFKSTMSCSPNDYYQLNKWYTCVIAKINEKWKKHIFKTYFL